MILGVGVDILHVPRLEALVSRRGLNALSTRILCYDEWNALDQMREDHKLRFLATRWAIKEAAFKAVQPAIRPTWKQFSFLALSNHRKPVLTFHRTGLGDDDPSLKLHASVSHDGEYVNAFVVAERQLA